MKKILLFAVCCVLCAERAHAFQLQSQREFGNGEGRNQNVTVACTTMAGTVTTELCRLRRFAKCTGTGANKVCDGWHRWMDVRHPGETFDDWRAAATSCCNRLGFR